MNLPSDLSAQQEVKLAGPRAGGQLASEPEALWQRPTCHDGGCWPPVPGVRAEPRGERPWRWGPCPVPSPSPPWAPPRHTQPGPWPTAPRPSGTQEGPDPGFSLPFLWVSAPPSPGLPHSGAGLQAAGVRLSWFSPRGGLAPTSRGPTSAPQALAHRREEPRASGSDRRKRVCPAGPRAGTARFVPAASGAGPGRRDGDTSPVTASAIGKDSRNRLGQVPCS